MEALSCGIPAVAPNVGGVSEIVNSSVGRLLTSNPTPKEISEAIQVLAGDKVLLKKTRKAAKQFWADHFRCSKKL